MRDRPPATVKIDSKIFTVINISEAGLVIEPYDGDLVVKQRVYFDLIIPVGEKDETFRAEAIITRREGNRVVGKFDNMRRDTLRAIQTVVAYRNAPMPAARRP
jgi:hypothetical protein